MLVVLLNIIYQSTIYCQIIGYFLSLYLFLGSFQTDNWLLRYDLLGFGGRKESLHLFFATGLPQSVHSLHMVCLYSVWMKHE